jgi:hypothetical protein
MTDPQFWLERDPDDTQPIEPDPAAAYWRDYWTANTRPAMRADPEPPTSPWWLLIVFLAGPCAFVTLVWLVTHT